MKPVHASTDRMKTRLLLVFVCAPIVLALMILDAACAAWDELATDWRDAKSAFMDEWRGQ